MLQPDGTQGGHYGRVNPAPTFIGSTVSSNLFPYSSIIFIIFINFYYASRTNADVTASGTKEITITAIVRQPIVLKALSQMECHTFATRSSLATLITSKFSSSYLLHSPSSLFPVFSLSSTSHLSVFVITSIPPLFPSPEISHYL